MPFVVVDAGNSRLKWGLADETAVHQVFNLPLDDPAAWDEQATNIARPCTWFVTGSNHLAMERIGAWLAANGQTVRRIDSYRQIGIQCAVERPETVGLDRLFNALAVSEVLQREKAAIVVSVGSAVTVDLIEAGGAFAGGAIFPGLSLMARSLRDYTSALPLVDVQESEPRIPGNATEPAMVAGIHGAVVGGIRYLVGKLQEGRHPLADAFLTGGDAPLLAKALASDFTLWPWMTLEGIRLTALAMR